MDEIIRMIEDDYAVECALCGSQLFYAIVNPDDVRELDKSVCATDDCPTEVPFGDVDDDEPKAAES